MLAFDVAVDQGVRERAREMHVQILESRIIYRLYDLYWASVAAWHAAEREKLRSETVFPAVLRCIAVFHAHAPLICGFRVVSGVLRAGAPLALRDREGGKFIGRVAGIQADHKDLDEALAGAEVAVRIDGGSAGRDGLFDVDDLLYTKVTRKSIDILKLHYRAELEGGWAQVVKLIKAELMVQ